MALYVSWTLLLTPFSLVLGTGDGDWQTMLAFLTFLLLFLLLYLFPDGRFIPRSNAGRIVLLAGLLVTPFLGLALVTILLPGYAPDEHAYGAVMFSIAVVMTCGVASQVYRYRNVSNPVMRQQTKWVLFGLSAQLIWILWVLWWILFDFQLLNSISQATWAMLTIHINILIPLLIPITLGLAVLRYRLWDIDPLINRTLVYFTLTSIIIVVYILIIGVLGVIFQDRGSMILALVATGAAAVIFQPLREWLQKTVNRLMYGERDNPLRTLNRLSRQVEQADTTEEILPSLVETVAAALKLPYVAISVPERDGPGWKVAAASGELSEWTESIPIVYLDQELGRLEVGLRSRGEKLGESDRMILATIAQLVSMTIRALELNEQLQKSRRQLVTAREEERRRIRRDLHDGLGPVLASLTIQADTTIDLLHSDLDEAAEMLKKIRGKAQSAVKDVRLLIHGLRPPALDELGLVGAVRQYTANLQPGKLVIDLDAPEHLPKLPAAVEVAAYRIIQEAVNNVIQHANSTSCTVRLAINNDLYVEIVDDGQGLPELGNRGVGIYSMRERAVELGGICTIEKTSKGGTCLRAQLPLNGLQDE